MKKFSVVLLGAVLFSTQAVYADTVFEEVPDTLPGKAFGGIAGFMVGAAAGGPIGAIGAGLASAWLGGKAQEATGQHGYAYRVRRDDGSVDVVRSPQKRWSVGEEVMIDGNRLAYRDR